jgi:uncharacterized protein (DUF2062 family)
MPRKFFKKHMPNEQTVRAKPALRWMGKYLTHPSLWHLNRRSVCRAFLVGIFCAFLPIPMQMLVAAIFAIILRSNLAVSLSVVWISNPITIPPIFYFTYTLGTIILDTEPLAQDMTFSYDYIISKLTAIWWPLITGSLASAVFFSVIAYSTINLLWICHVKNSWKQRKFRKK